MQEKNISDILINEWKERAIYTVEERAIPSFVDGFKPVQRFNLYQGLDLARKNFSKVAAIASTVAVAGYHHGEKSASDALVAMTATYKNNLPIFLEDGNFGSKIDGSSAASRYIFAKISPLFDVLFLDNDLLIPNEDVEIKTPKYYLPIIPMILVNNIAGIATGYSCNIPPHDPISIVDSLISLCDGEGYKDISPKYFDNTSKVTKDGNRYIVEGLYETDKSTVKIKEIPPNMDGNDFVKNLIKLEESGKILKWIDRSNGDTFDYTVYFKRGCVPPHEDIVKMFKLQYIHTWNVTSISEHGKLQQWCSETAFKDIVTKFYIFRLDYIKKRIEKKLVFLEKTIPDLEAYIRFCHDVCSKEFSFSITEKEMKDVLSSKYLMSEGMVQKTINTAVRRFTKESIKETENELKGLNKELKYFQKVTPEEEYKKNLQDLRKYIVKNY